MRPITVFTSPARPPILLFEVNGFTNTIIRQVSVGAEPFGVAYNRTNHKVYVANFASGNVSVVDPVSMTVIKTINTGFGSEPTQVAVNSVTNRIYVTLHGTHGLSVIDGGGNNIIATVPDLAGAFDVVSDELLNRAYVSTRNGGYVATIDTANNVKILQTHVGGFPYTMAIDPDRRRLYVVYAPRTGMQDDTAIDTQVALPLIENEPQVEEPNKVIVFEIKPNELGRLTTLTAGLAGDQGGLGIGVNRTTHNFFVSNAAGNSLTVFDGDSLQSPATVPMQGSPAEIGVNSATNRVYVGNRSSGIISTVVDVW